MRRGGFTIVELLIVIVVIGILAAITVVAFNGIQNRTRATAVGDSFKKIEKAMRLYATDSGASGWWLETSFGVGSNPPLNTIINNTDLKRYLQPFGPVSGFPSSTYIYDNDGDVEPFDGCGQTLDGINIRVTNLSQTIAQTVDDTMDDGDLNCGRVRWYSTGSQVKYILSETQSI